MHLHRCQRFIQPFSTPTRLSSSSSSLNWRTQIKQSSLVSQISSILLQRHSWDLLLRNLNLSLKITPSLFFQILRKIQSNPEISLNFFNWVRTHLGFEPDLKSQCHVIRIALQSSISQPVKPILESLVQTHPASVVAESMIRVCEGKDSQSGTLSLVLECYSCKGFFKEGLEVFRRMRIHGVTPSLRACNALFDALQRENEIGLAWCFYGAVVRVGVAPNQLTWSLVAQIHCKNGKFERLVGFLDMGVYNSMIYSLVIDGYSKNGDFGAAFDRLNEMCERKINPSFGTYSSILDGACRYKDSEAIERIMGMMKCHLSENNLIIQKLSDLGKTYAAEMFFKRACNEKIGLRDGTYGSMLRALSKEGRIDEAIQIYWVIMERGIMVDNSCYYGFVNLLCKKERSEVYELLRDIIGRGYCPAATELSTYITLQCRKRRWREAEGLLNLILDTGSLPDSLCCGSLVKHYCSSRQIDKAITLHEKIEKLKGSLDVTAYNILLDGLWKEGKSEEAVRVFDYMKGINMVSSASFVSMISGLCRIKQLRRAMKIHDEMLKMGLKPDKASYKRLISGFK
ncbi:hypothetical protein SLA2020_469620 [Shorea laevis]